MNELPPLAIPRGLLDPALALGEPDGEGLVRVRIQQREGRITGLVPHAGPEPAGGIPLALTPLVEAHAHLDKAFTAPEHSNASGTMEEAMVVNRREAGQRTAEGVHNRAERALDQAWRYGLRAMRSHVDSLGPWSETCWEVLSSLRQRWAGRVELELVALVPIQHWLSEAGERQARAQFFGASGRRSHVAESRSTGRGRGWLQTLSSRPMLASWTSTLLADVPLTPTTCR